MAACGGGGYSPSKNLKLSAKLSNQKKSATKQSPPPMFISTDPIHINPNHLRNLYTLCNHSAHRFPNRDSAGRVEPVDTNKLRIAVAHSTAVVSVFVKPDFETELGGDWIQRLLPLSPVNGRLVGFGRAVSDAGLTASIYDVMVTPELQRRGIGRMIVGKIIKMLTNRGIYDIAALCTGEERLFFRAIGFGFDALESTTMMYTRTGSNSLCDQMIQRAGRKLLLVPPLRETFQ